MDKLIDTEVLIGLVEHEAALWNTNDELYKNKDEKAKSWEKIASEIHPEWKELSDKDRKEFLTLLQKRWKSAKDAYQRDKNKPQRILKSGQAAKKVTKYVFSEQLKFLDEVSNINDSRESNFVEDENNDKTDNEDEEVIDVVDDVKGKNDFRKKPRNHFENEILKEFKKEEDPDRNYLMSLLPNLKEMNDFEKLYFKGEVNNILLKMKINKSGPPQTFYNPPPFLHTSSYTNNQPAFPNPTFPNSQASPSQQRYLQPGPISTFVPRQSAPFDPRAPAPYDHQRTPAPFDPRAPTPYDHQRIPAPFHPRAPAPYDHQRTPAPFDSSPPTQRSSPFDPNMYDQ